MPWNLPHFVTSTCTIMKNLATQPTFNKTTWLRNRGCGDIKHCDQLSGTIYMVYKCEVLFHHPELVLQPCHELFFIIRFWRMWFLLACHYLLTVKFVAINHVSHQGQYSSTIPTLHCLFAADVCFEMKSPLTCWRSGKAVEHFDWEEHSAESNGTQVGLQVHKN